MPTCQAIIVMTRLKTRPQDAVEEERPCGRPATYRSGSYDICRDCARGMAQDGEELTPRFEEEAPVGTFSNVLDPDWKPDDSALKSMRERLLAEADQPLALQPEPRPIAPPDWARRHNGLDLQAVRQELNTIVQEGSRRMEHETQTWQMVRLLWSRLQIEDAERARAFSRHTHVVSVDPSVEGRDRQATVEIKAPK